MPYQSTNSLGFTFVWQSQCGVDQMLLGGDRFIAGDGHVNRLLGFAVMRRHLCGGLYVVGF